MYYLLVSRNCGISYNEEAKGETITEFDAMIMEVNKQGLRWVVEDDAGNIQTDLPVFCDVFAKLFNGVPFKGE